MTFSSDKPSEPGIYWVTDGKAVAAGRRLF